MWSGLVRWWANVADDGPALSRYWPDTLFLSGRSVTITGTYICFCMTCKPFVAGHFTVHVTKINKHSIISQPLAIINFTMPGIWQDVPDSKTITIKQNVRFHIRICSGNIQL